MKKIPITEEQEEIEINDLVEFVINHPCADKHLKKRRFKGFIEDKLDPKEKFVIRGYDDKNGRILHEESNNIYSSHFLGQKFKKVKLQVRLEDEEDIVNLIKFLNFIKPCLNQTQEESINNNRNRALKDILDDDQSFVIPKIKMNF